MSNVNNKQSADALLKGIKFLVDNAVKNAPMDKTYSGLIKGKNIDNTYDVEIQGQIYTHVQSVFSDLKENDTVKVRIPQNQYSQMYIDGKPDIMTRIKNNLPKPDLSGYEEALKNMNELAANTLGFYFTAKKLEDGSVIAYRHDKPNLADSKIVYKNGIEGFFVTRNYTGDDSTTKWESGFDSKGNAVLNILSAIGIQAQWINTRGLKAQDNQGNITFEITQDGDVNILANSFTLASKDGSGNKDILDVITGISKDQVNSFINGIYNDDITNIQKKLDGQIQTHYFDYEPTLNNPPASEWISDEEKRNHEGDMFYWKSKGFAYRFLYDDEAQGYKWQLIRDSEVTEALKAAQDAQATADKKIRTFLITPKPPYEKGDLWMQSKEDGGDILVSKVNRLANEPFNREDWVKTNKYTDDTVANQALEIAKKSKNITVNLSNDYQGVQADFDGNVVTPFPDVRTTVSVYYGQQNITKECTYSIATSDGLKGRWDDTYKTYVVTGLDKNSDTGWVDITATYITVLSVTKRFKVSKIKNGKPSYLHIAYGNKDSAGNIIDFSTSDPTNKEFLGFYGDENLLDSQNPNDYTWTKIKGEDGVGTPGQKGEDGTSSWFHNAYAFERDVTLNEAGEVINIAKISTTDSTGREYLGVYVDYSKGDVPTVDSPDWRKYSWSKIRGKDGLNGANGLPGKDGVNGKTTYFHIKYAPVQNPTASQMTETPNIFIGTYVDFTEKDSEDPTKYTWSKFQGIDGADGIPGVNGENGKTSYLHIAYANSEDGSQGFSVSDSKNKIYIGQYTDFTQADSTDYKRYSWSKIKGENGTDGIPGKDGIDGKPSYSHFAYANKNEQGGIVDFSVDDPSNRSYLGAYSDNVLEDSVDPARYTWSLIKGLDGKDGIPGKNGTFIHLAYANSADGKKDFVVSKNADSQYLYIGTYTDRTEADSLNPDDYNWSRMAGENGTQGINLVLKSNKFLDETKVDTTGTKALELDLVEGFSSQVRGKTMTLSADTSLENAIKTPAGKRNRLIAELFVKYEDNTVEYFSASEPITDTPKTEKKRIKKIFNLQNKNIIKQRVGIYIQDLGGGKAKISNVKLEIGNVDNPVWTPAIEDLQGQSVKTFTTNYTAQTQTELEEWSANGYGRTWEVAESTEDSKKGDTVLLKVINKAKNGTAFIMATIDEVKGVHSLVCTSTGLIDKGDIGIPGENGAPATNYYIETNAQILKRGKNNIMSPNKVIARAFYTKGESATRHPYSGRWKIETSKNGETWEQVSLSSIDENEKTYSLANLNVQIQSIRFTLYTSGGTTQPIDMETIPIVFDTEQLTNEDILDLITDGGTQPIIKMIGGKLYINGTLIQSDTISADAIKTGTITIGKLDQATKDAINNGTSANTILNNNKEKWDNASSWYTGKGQNLYNMISKWADGAISQNTLINGGMIKTNTIFANQIALSDFNNYVTVNEYYPKSGITQDHPFGTGANSIIVGDHIEKKDESSKFLALSSFQANNFEKTDEFYFEFSVKSVDGFDLPVYLGMWFYNNTANKASISQTFQIQGTEYKKCTGTIRLNNLPGNIRDFKKFAVGIYNSSGSGFHIRNIKLYKKNGGNLIVDGSITSPKLKVGEIAGIGGGGTVTVGGFDINEKRIISQSPDGNRQVYIASTKHNNSDAFVVQRKVNNNWINVAMIKYDGSIELRNTTSTGASDSLLNIKDGGVTFKESGRTGWKDTMKFTPDGIEGKYNNYCKISMNADNADTITGDVASGWQRNVLGDTLIYGDLEAQTLRVRGTKQIIANTEHYGEQSFYCDETPTPILSDYGEGIISEDGLCYVSIDDIFNESINSNIQYFVFLQKEGQGDCWVEEKSQMYFIVKGTPGLKFSWGMKAKQLGKEYIRFNDSSNISNLKFKSIDLEREYFSEYEKILNQENQKEDMYTNNQFILMKEMENMYNEKANIIYES